MFKQLFEKNDLSLLPEHINILNNFSTKDINKTKSINTKMKIAIVKLLLLLVDNNSKFTEYEMQMLNELVISVNNISGNFYHISNLKHSGKIRFFKPNSQRNYNILFKNFVISKIEELKLILPDLKIRFKSRGMIIDNPPDISHIPYSFKIQKLLNGYYTTKGKDIFNDTKLKQMKSELNIDLSEVYFYGAPGGISSIFYMTSFIQKRILATSDSDNKTNDYFYKFAKYISDVYWNQCDYKLGVLNRTILLIFHDIVKDAFSICENEGRSLLKDFGELIIYFISLGEYDAVYLPVSGAFPLIDMIAIKDEKIEYISVKTKFFSSAEGSPASALKVFEVLSNFNKKINEVFEIQHLMKNKVSYVNDELLQKYKKDVKLIKNISRNNYLTVLNKLNLNEKTEDRIYNGTEYHYNKMFKLVKESEKYKIFKEVCYRQYVRFVIDNVLINKKLKLPIIFKVLSVNNNDIKLKTSIADRLYSCDKGVLSNILYNNSGNITNVKYEHGNIGIRVKLKEIN